MKIVSDNAELLEEIFNQLKLKEIEVEPKRRPAKDTDMSEELELAKLILENLGYAYVVKCLVPNLMESAIIS